MPRETFLEEMVDGVAGSIKQGVTMGQEQRLPKFKVGQIVVMKSLKKELPFRILSTMLEDDEWYYAWDQKNLAAEHMIRPLTAEECGDSHASLVGALRGCLEVLESLGHKDLVCCIDARAALESEK